MEIDSPVVTLAGFRNRIRNGNFAINQRAVSGTVTLAAGAYGQDGVKAGALGATYTFATSGIDTVLTITAGSIILPIEAGMIEGGVYMLSQAGGAQARVWQGTGTSGSGSYAAVPFQTANLSAATQTNVEFSTGTVSRVQFETGAVVTAFERRNPQLDLALNQRYYQNLITSFQFYSAGPNSSYRSSIGFVFPVPMRATPTASLGAVTSSASLNVSINTVYVGSIVISYDPTSTTTCFDVGRVITLSAEL